MCRLSLPVCSFAIEHIVFPNQTNQQQIQHSFFELGGFPMVLGYIDGSHVPIVAPSHKEEIYVNRKSFHSMNMQAICDDTLKFIAVVAKCPGNTHDSFISRQSRINQKVSFGEIPTIKGWFLGDSGYSLKPNLLTPILSPTTPSEIRYNRSFVKRKTIECAFDLWKTRWRSMDKSGGTLCHSL